MRTDIPTALQTHLDSRETTLCWCWKIERKDGTVMGFTNHDRDLIFDSVTYKASTGFLGTEVEARVGMSVDNMDVMGALSSAEITETDIRAGWYDNADITLYLVNWQDVTQRVLQKKGHLGEVKRGETHFKTEVRGLSHELQQPQGRTYNYTCDARLGDSRCAKVVSGSTYTGTGAVVSSADRSTIVASGIGSYANRWFTHGKITFTSGSNNGLSREVQAHSNANGIVVVTLWEPLPFDLAASDTFSIVAGCDKRWATCKDKFSNGNNFRGFPHIPGPNAVASYANKGDANMDGGGNFYGKD